MGFIAKAKTKTTTTTTSEKRGMGFLLVFFPEDHSHNNNNTSLSPNTTTRLIKRTNSSLIFTKAQSTISICALLVFLTLLLFTLSTFEPTIPTPTTTTTTITSRRFLSQTKPNTNTNTTTNHNSWFLKLWSTENSNPNPKTQRKEHSSIALQRMGTLYRRGTRAMSDLVVGHVNEDVNEDDLRLFCRVLHRSGLTSRADIVFIFGSSSLSRFTSVIQEENESFLKLIHYYKETNTTHQESLLGFDLTQFVKFSKKEMTEPLWGKRIRVNNNNNNYNSGEVVERESETELTRLSYGSVVSFEANELDPEDSLKGFLEDHVSMSLRRWACYPMLLGRVRRNFKHVLLVDVKNSVLLGDPLSRVRNRSPESVFIMSSASSSTSSNKHHKKNSDKPQSHCLVNSVVLMGGVRGIRRLSNSMLTEIVRAAMQHKKKSLVTESAILNQLVCNGYLLKNINLIKSTESIPDTSSLTGLSLNFVTRVDYPIIQRGNSNYYDLNSIIMRHICSCEVDSSVYKNC